MSLVISAGLNCVVRWNIDRVIFGNIPKHHEDGDKQNTPAHNAIPTFPCDWIGVTTSALPLMLKHRSIGEAFLPSSSYIDRPRCNPQNPCLWVWTRCHGQLVASMHDIFQESPETFEQQLAALRAKFQRRLERLLSTLGSTNVLLVRYQLNEPMDASPASWNESLTEVQQWLDSEFPDRCHMLAVLSNKDTPEFTVPNEMVHIKLHELPYVHTVDPNEWQETHYHWSFVFGHLTAAHLNRIAARGLTSPVDKS